MEISNLIPDKNLNTGVMKHFYLTCMYSDIKKKKIEKPHIIVEPKQKFLETKLGEEI